MALRLPGSIEADWCHVEIQVAPASLMMRLVDTHCHLDFRDFDVDRAAVLERAAQAGLERMIIPGIDLRSCRNALQLAARHPQISCAVGVHPNSASSWDAQSLDELRDLAQRPQVVAIGEIGLDYYRDRAPRPLQQRVLRHQLELAENLGLPVIIHTRNQSEQERACMRDTLTILKEYQNRVKGVLHSFSGNEFEAHETLEIDYYIGITGPITFKKAEEMRQVVAVLPLERILIETDAPFLTPHPYRGQRNEPAYVRYVAEKIAEIHNQPPNAVAEVTTANARRLFHWSN